MCIEGGYKTVTPIEISNLLSALGAGEVTARGARVYLAGLTMVAVREAAKRSKRSRPAKRPSTVRYSVRELSRLVGISDAVARKEIRCLTRLGLMEFGEQAISFSEEVMDGSETMLDALSGGRARTRPVPIPRTLLRHLARNGTRSLITTALVYAARGLSLGRSGELKGAGTVKASWIARSTGLSLRAVKAGRKALILSGFISKDAGSFQRKLNRDGAYFVINLAWRPPSRISPVLLVKHVDSSPTVREEFAPPQAKNDAVFAPPYKDRKTSSYEESKNQKALPQALNPSGVLGRRGRDASNKRQPTLRNIVVDDLERLSSLDALFGQAVRAGWIGDSEANRLNWFATAARAISTDARDPVRIFVSIVRRRAWHLLTHAQEERARIGITKLRNVLRATVPLRGTFLAEPPACKRSAMT